MGRFTTRQITDNEYKKMVETLRAGYIYNGVHHRPDEETAAMLVLESNIGCRIGDIVNLRTDSIKKNGSVYVLDIDEEKTGKKRTFIVADEVEEFIHDYCLNHGIESGRIFTFGKGNVFKKVRTLCAYMGLQDVATHSLRKRAATLLYEQSGHDIALVSQWLNHSSVKITERYLKRNSEQMETAINGIVNII